MEHVESDYLGCGLGLRHSHFRHILENHPKVDFFEALSENYLASQGIAKKFFLGIAEHYPMTLHGVSMSIGSSDELDLSYLKLLRELAREVNAKMISDHLCWTGVMGKNTHDLLPLPYSEESLQTCIRKVSQAQDFLGQKLYIENPSSYMGFKGSTLTEWQFLNELTRATGCGLLLDVNNVFVNSYNHGFAAEQFIDCIDKESIGYIHLAGHSQRKGYLLDSHKGPIPDQVWKLYQYAMQQMGKRSVLIEWDEDIPEFQILYQELEKVKQLDQAFQRTQAVERKPC